MVVHFFEREKRMKSCKRIVHKKDRQCCFLYLPLDLCRINTSKRGHCLSMSHPFIPEPFFMKKENNKTAMICI